MALGDIASNPSKAKKAVCLLAGVTATNSPPSAATDGIPVYPTNTISADDGVCYSTVPGSESSIMLKVVGSGGTVAATFRLWGYLAALGVWIPVGTGTDADKGKLNAGNTSIGEVTSNVALHAEPLLYVGHFDRLYLEVTAISGTDATATAYVVTSRPV